MDRHRHRGDVGKGAAPSDRTVDPQELAKFAAMADEWWDPEGKFRPLHKFNPARIAFLRDRIAAHFGRDIRSEHPFHGIAILDVGCGGGLLCEPMARLGATVIGIDAAVRNIETARIHAERMGLDIDYRCATAGALADTGATFDVILNMEVVEHVADPVGFVADCAQLLRPGGLMLVGTLNRTLKSFAFAIVGAEYVLHWLPRGTHDWRRFLRPSELAAAVRSAGLGLVDLCGMTYDPLRDQWTLAPRDLAVNYMAVVVKPAADTVTAGTGRQGREAS